MEFITSQYLDTLDDAERRKIIINEIAKCYLDPIYFINNYVWIKHPTRGIIRFKTYDYQDDALVKFLKYRRVIVLKSRQLGMSTLYEAYVLWRLIFHKAQEILIAANKGATATGMVQKIRFMLKRLPEWLIPSKDAEGPKKLILVDNRQSLELFNDSKVKAVTTTTDSGVGDALSLLVIDEAAIIPHKKADEFWKSIEPTITRGGDCIIISTPREVGHWYHKMWIGAKNKQNGFFPIIIGWEAHPEQDDKWAKKMIKQKGVDYFSREYACQFVGEGSALVSYKVIEDVKKWVENSVGTIPLRRERTIVDPPNEKTIYIFEDPQPDAKYIITADVARGDGGDPSTFSIWKLPTITEYDTGVVDQVVEYSGFIRPDIFAEVIYEYLLKYNKAFLACELNTFGDHVNMEIDKKGYRNMWYDVTQASKLQATGEQKYKAIPGFTTGNNRKLAISILQAFINNKVIRIRGNRTYEELMTFVWNVKSNKYEAIGGAHDDLIATLWIMSYIWYDLRDRNKANRAFLNFMLSGNMRTSEVYSYLPKPLRNYGFNQTGNTNAPDFLVNQDLLWLLDPKDREKYKKAMEQRD